MRSFLEVVLMFLILSILAVGILIFPTATMIVALGGAILFIRSIPKEEPGQKEKEV